MPFTDSENDFRSGDNDNNLLRKILRRLFSIAGLVENIEPTVVLEPGDIEIGAVEIKDSTTDTRTAVLTADPVAATPGVVVRNIPSGEQLVNNIHDIANPVFDAVVHGHLHLDGAKAASVYHVLGRRAGFNSTSILQDVAEFLGVSINAIPELTGVESLEVVSSNAADTLAGIGAQKVRITYLNTSNNMVDSADISLNGVTPVPAGFNAKFIYWMEVSQVGTNTVAVGNVILRVVGPGATHEQITAGGNRSMTNRFQVPTGYTGYIYSWQLSGTGGTTVYDGRLRATVFTASRALNTAYIFQDNALANGDSAPASTELPWLKVPALAKIKVSLLPSATAAANRVDSDFTILLVAD